MHEARAAIHAFLSDTITNTIDDHDLPAFYCTQPLRSDTIRKASASPRGHIRGIAQETRPDPILLTFRSSFLKL
jgi:hypothetical protein